MDYRQLISQLRLPYRGDCIVCGNKNTFSAALVNGQIAYNCFHASCGIKGRIDHEFTIDVLRTMDVGSRDRHWGSPYSDSSSQREQQGTCNDNIPLQLPDYFVPATSNPDAVAFLTRFKLTGFYALNADRIKYDPRQHRLVFILKDYNNVIQGATGRGLAPDINPKWYVYSRQSGCPFISMPTIQDTTKILLVEDCISAIHGFKCVDTIALLGTSIPDDTMAYLTRFEHLIIALDADASLKSLALQRKLSAYRPTSIILLQKDIKYMEQEEIKKLVYEFL